MLTEKARINSLLYRMAVHIPGEPAFDYSWYVRAIHSIQISLVASSALPWLNHDKP